MEPRGPRNNSSSQPPPSGLKVILGALVCAPNRADLAGWCETSGREVFSLCGTSLDHVGVQPLRPGRESSFPHAAQRTERDGRGADDEEDHVAHLRSLWKVPPSGTSSGATTYWRSALDCMFSILVLMVAPSSVVVRAFQRTSNTSHITSSPSKMPICGLQITARGVRTPKPWNIVM